jgi:hypothetical protein
MGIMSFTVFAPGRYRRLVRELPSLVLQRRSMIDRKPSDLTSGE